MENEKWRIENEKTDLIYELRFTIEKAWTSWVKI